MMAGVVKQEGEEGKSECEMERSNRLVFYGLGGDASSWLCLYIRCGSVWRWAQKVSLSHYGLLPLGLNAYL